MWLNPEPRLSSPHRTRWRVLLALALLAACLCWLLSESGGALGFQILRRHHNDLQAMVDTHPAAAIVLTFLLHTLLAALALPGASLLMLAAGACFGSALGTLLCLGGCTLGATLTMLASRRWLAPVVRRRHGAELDAFEARMAVNGSAYLFSLRLLPVLPFVVVNLAAGLTPIKTWNFAWVSFLGMAIGTFAYVNAGTELGHARELSDLHSPGMLVSLLVLALLPWLGKRLTPGHASKIGP